MASRVDQQPILVGVTPSATNARAGQNLQVVALNPSTNNKVRAGQSFSLVGVHQPNQVRCLQRLTFVMIRKTGTAFPTVNVAVS